VKDLSPEAEAIRAFNRSALEAGAPAIVFPLYHCLRFLTGDGARPFIGKNARILEFLGLEGGPAVLRRLKRGLVWLKTSGWLEMWARAGGSAGGSHRLLVLSEPGEQVLTDRARAGLDAADWSELVYELFAHEGRMNDVWLKTLEDQAEVSQTSPRGVTDVPSDAPEPAPDLGSGPLLNSQERFQKKSQKRGRSARRISPASFENENEKGTEMKTEDRSARDFERLTGQAMPADPMDRVHVLIDRARRILEADPNNEEVVAAGLNQQLDRWGPELRRAA